jgi:hypothetical protein
MAKLEREGCQCGEEEGVRGRQVVVEVAMDDHGSGECFPAELAVGTLALTRAGAAFAQYGLSSGHASLTRGPARVGGMRGGSEAACGPASGNTWRRGWLRGMVRRRRSRVAGLTAEGMCHWSAGQLVMVTHRFVGPGGSLC